MSFAHENVAKLGKFTRASRENTNASVLSLVWDKSRDGEHHGCAANFPGRTKPAGVPCWRENFRIRSEVERRNGRKLLYADLFHHRARQIGNPVRCRCNTCRLSEYSSRGRSFEPALLRLNLLTEKIAAVHVDDVRNVKTRMHP